MEDDLQVDLWIFCKRRLLKKTFGNLIEEEFRFVYGIRILWKKTCRYFMEVCLLRKKVCRFLLLNKNSTEKDMQLFYGSQSSTEAGL